VLLYIGLGLYLLIEPHSFNLPGSAQLILGIVLVVYGLYRVFRTIKKLKDSKIENFED